MFRQSFTPLSLRDPLNPAAVFSPNRDYLACSGPDGILKIWETTSGITKQEYTPSSHLSATCTCLSWASQRRTNRDTPRKKKKRRSESSEELVTDVLAIGTTSGSILLYSMVKGDLQTELDGGHADAVNDICWHSEENTLYSCSNDRHIAEWDIKAGKVKHKWKADKGSVTAIVLCPGKKCLLSAGRTIKLWDLHSKDVLKTFTGHATEVSTLLYVPLAPNHPLEAGNSSVLHDLDTSYFLSAAAGDRLVNAWRITQSSKDKNAIAAFALQEQPVLIDISKPTTKTQPLLLAAVTKDGQLVIFEHVLNGNCKKPVQAKINIQIATPGSKTDVPTPIQILGAAFCNDKDGNILISYGSFMKPSFEKLPYNSDEQDVCLIREDPTKTTLTVDIETSKIKTTQVSKDVKVLAPGHIAPSGPSQSETGGKKKKKRKMSTNEMSMADRLDAITIDKSTEKSGATQPPKADTLALLLTQGLQSNDQKILNNVLQNTNETVIRTTVRRLPIPIIIPLVQELSKRMHGHAQSGHTLVKWTKTVLTIHTSYLMTIPELVDTLSTLYTMMDSRVNMLGRLSKLQGKLDLMLSQITCQAPDCEETVASQQPLLIFQDDSSDEDLMEDIVPSHSESEDNWENLSDMEVQDENSADKSDDEESLTDEEDME